MVRGGLTCKECGGKEICTLSWCWQHKCGVGKIILCLSCPNVSDWLRGLFRFHRQVIEGDTETDGDYFLADEV